MFILNVNKKVVSCSGQLRTFFPKSYSSFPMPLQSGIFTINKKLIIGLVSSMITAAIFYGIRYYVSNYLALEILPYKEILAGIAALLSCIGIGFSNGGLTIFQKDCAGGPMPVSSSRAGSDSLPRGSSAAGLTSSMQAPNNPGSSSSSADPSSTAVGNSHPAVNSADIDDSLENNFGWFCGKYMVGTGRPSTDAYLNPRTRLYEWRYISPDGSYIGGYPNTRLALIFVPIDESKLKSDAGARYLGEKLEVVKYYHGQYKKPYGLYRSPRMSVVGYDNYETGPMTKEWIKDRYALI